MQMKVDSEEHLSSKFSDLIFFFFFLFCLVNLRSGFDQNVTIILLVKNVRQAFSSIISWFTSLIRVLAYDVKEATCKRSVATINGLTLPVISLLSRVPPFFCLPL